jgi:tetratricopeptide (TPR) repeat protein
MPRPVAESERVDLARTLFLLDRVYRFTGLGDGSAPLNNTSEKLLSNYAASFLQIGLMLRKPLMERRADIVRLEAAASRSPDSAARLASVKKGYHDTLSLVLARLDQCVALMPADWRPRALRHEMLIADGRIDEAEKKMRQAHAIDPANSEYVRMLAGALDARGNTREAGELMKRALNGDPDSWEKYLEVAQNYLEIGYFDSALAIMRQFAAAHPGDGRPQSAISQIAKIRDDQLRQNGAAGVKKVEPERGKK